MIENLYYILWHDICKQKQPFTWTIRAEQKANPWLFAILFILSGVLIGWKFKQYIIPLLIGMFGGLFLGHFFWQ
jgi:hypothetical protein